MTYARRVVLRQGAPSPPPPPAPRCPAPRARSRKNSARWLHRQRTIGHRPARPAPRARRRGRAARANRSRARTGRGPSAIPPAVLACRRKSIAEQGDDLVDRLRGQRAVAGVFQFVRKAAAEKAFDAGLAERAQMKGCPSRCAWWRRADCRPSAAPPARPAPASPCRRGRAAGRARRRPSPAARDESESLRRRSDWSAR